MPASTLDPVNAALRTALTKSNMDNGSLNAQLVGSTKKALLSNIEFEPAGSYQNSVLDKLKSKYILLKNPDTVNNISKKCGTQENAVVNGECLPKAKHELFPLENVHLGWNNSDWNVGAGMVNMGNTCYLNSTLQALFHVPSLVNWLVSDKSQLSACEDSGSHCIICAMRKTLLDSQQKNISSIRPFLIYNKLRVLCRHLIPGRQEDAHEFLRYLVEAMEKSYLNRFKNHSQFDSRTKETTPLNQILGGYLRSAVRCLDCGHVSTTFQHFQDLLLDIRKPQTLEEALDGYFSREKLDDESYHCEACKKKVLATKQFSLERAPMVLCIQLKRFSVTNNKITKNIQFKQRLDLTKYTRQRPAVPYVYQLVALVTHMGPTVNCGHYTAVAQAPCGNFYQFDDSMVRPISHQAVFSTNAYIMLYELERAPTLNGNKPMKPNMTSPMGTKTLYKSTSSETLLNNSCSVSHNSGSNSISHQTTSPNSKLTNSHTSNRVYGPELPPPRTPKLLKLSPSGSENTNGLHATDKTTRVTVEAEQQNCTANEFKSKTLVPTNAASAVVTSDTSNKENTNLVKPLTTSSSVNKNGISSSATATSTATGTIATVRKLVPYDADDNDSSSENENENNVSPLSNGGSTLKAANGEWKVTSTVSETQQRHEGNKSNSLATVSKLMKMSHSGYAGHVATWSGTKSQISKETENETRAEKKRSFSDDVEMDKGRVKHVKLSNGIGSKSNPGYNPIQEYQNTKNWGVSTNSYRQFYNKNRHRNRRNFHHNKKKYHKEYRFKR